jgi:hypothetical protein
MSLYIAADDSEGYRQFSPLANCTHFKFNQLIMFDLVKGISSAVCLIISVSILVLLLCVLKAYKSTLQRLITYKAVLTILHQFCGALQLEHQFSYSGHVQSTVCSILGAFYVYTAVVDFTFSAIIITYLLYLVLRLYFKGSLSHSKVVNYVVELICIFIPFILPLFFLWTPFMHYGFGLGGYDCWIRNMDSRLNCTGVYTDLKILYSVFEAISLEMLVSSAVVFVVYFRMRTRVKRKHIHTLIQKTCFLVSFHAVAFSVFTAALGVAFYLKIISVNQSLMISEAILIPTIHEFSLIVLFFASLRICTSNSNVKKSHQQEQRRRGVKWDNDVLSSKDLKTRPPKLSIFTQPSYTVSRSMPYTGGFDSNEENMLILTSSADHPNTDYGAVPQRQTEFPVNH